MGNIFHAERVNGDYDDYCRVAVSYSPIDDVIFIDIDARAEFISGAQNEYGGGSGWINAHDFLEALAKNQANSFSSGRLELQRSENNSWMLDNVIIAFSEGSIEIHISGNRYFPPAGVHLDVNDVNFLFLDSLSVIEASYNHKKDPRDIELSVIEQAFIELTSRTPELVHSYHPREFEYFVASLLTNIGFSSVKLSRYWNDSGRDIWATYCEGEQAHVVVVEVKHYNSHTVGIEIIDRLNGVRDRENASRGMIVTNSSFSRPAIEAYASVKDRISLIDYQRLVEILQESGSWGDTPSGLWAPQWHKRFFSSE